MKQKKLISSRIDDKTSDIMIRISLDKLVSIYYNIKERWQECEKQAKKERK